MDDNPDNKVIIISPIRPIRDKVDNQTEDKMDILNDRNSIHF